MLKTLLVGLGGTGGIITKKLIPLIPETQWVNFSFLVMDSFDDELANIKKDCPLINTVSLSSKYTVGDYLHIDSFTRENVFPVHPLLFRKSLTHNAGQVRAIAYLAFLAAMKQNKLRPLDAEIDKLCKHEGAKSLNVILISSLGGGTGSGILLPVSLYIKNYLKKTHQISDSITRGCFVLPDVYFSMINSPTERECLRINTYATLREINAFIHKADNNLPEQYNDTVKLMFPIINSDEFEEYSVPPMDICFLYDAQNAQGELLNSFHQYTNQVAACIYAQTTKGINAREDAIIRTLTGHSRNFYGGAGVSRLMYPFEDVKEYLAMTWVNNTISEQWFVFDNPYKQLLSENEAKKAAGLQVENINSASLYIDEVEKMVKQRQPLAMLVKASCRRYEEDGITVISEKWTEYVDALLYEITREICAQCENLDRYKSHTTFLVDSLKEDGGKYSWDCFIDAYREIEKYRIMTIKYSDEIAYSIAYILLGKISKSMTANDQPYKLESYFQDGEGLYIHPNAIRYFLYKVHELLSEHRNHYGYVNRDSLYYFDNFEKRFDDPKTDEIETVVDLVDKKVPLLSRLFNKLTSEQQDLRYVFKTYIKRVDDYRISSITELVLDEVIEYVGLLCYSYQMFYSEMERIIPTFVQHITALEQKRKSSEGTNNRYVCASEICLKKLRESYTKSNDSIFTDERVSRSIFKTIHNYARFSTKPDNTYFADNLKNELINTYASEINMDILTALEKEAMYEKGLTDENEISKYIAETIWTTRMQSFPFAEKPIDETKPVQYSVYNPILHSNSSHFCIVQDELMNYGGIMDTDVGKNEILFYQAFHGMKASDIPKFSSNTRTTAFVCNGGEYYKAYQKAISAIDDDGSHGITPHIHKDWHHISAFPEIDAKE